MCNKKTLGRVFLSVALLVAPIANQVAFPGMAMGQNIEVESKAGTDGFVNISDVVKRNSENIESHEKRITALESNVEKVKTTGKPPASMSLPERVSSETVTVSRSRPAENSGGWAAGNVSGGSTGNVSRWSSSVSSSNAGSTGNSFVMSTPIVTQTVPIVTQTSPIVVATPRIVSSPPTIVYEAPPAPAQPPTRRPLRKLFAPQPTACRVVNGVRICN